MGPHSKVKVLVATSSFAVSDQAPLKRLIEAGCEVVENPFGRKLTKSELMELLGHDVVGLIAGLEQLDCEVLERSKLRVVSRCGSGVSNVDRKAARELGIAVYSTADAPVTAVAELVLGALLCLLRSVPRMDRALHQKRWEKCIGHQLAGKLVAVVGLGRIGRRVSQLLTAFEARVIGVDPAVTGEVERISVVSLDEALGLADIITLHCSGEKCVLGKREFGLMRQGVYLLNAARGGLIDEQALIGALQSGRVAGAYLDTFSAEPYSGPLCDDDRVILTPHVGSYTAVCRSRMEMEAVENLVAGLSSCR